MLFTNTWIKEPLCSHHSTLHLIQKLIIRPLNFLFPCFHFHSHPYPSKLVDISKQQIYRWLSFSLYTHEKVITLAERCGTWAKPFCVHWTSYKQHKRLASINTGINGKFNTKPINTKVLLWFYDKTFLSSLPVRLCPIHRLTGWFDEDENDIP